MTLNLADDIIESAKRGDATALHDIVIHSQDRIHSLAIRMVVDPGLAEDATQEILIRVVTSLSTFRGESKFETWVYRIAINYLLNEKKLRDRDPGLTFGQFGDDLIAGLVDDESRAPDEHVLLNQLRIKCSMAMLMCLDVKHRAAYVLGDVFEFNHSEAAEALGLSNDAFRKQLSRARSKVLKFTSEHCGLVSSSAACTCPRRLPNAMAIGRVTLGDQAIVSDAPSYHDVETQAKMLNKDLRAAKLQRSMGQLRSPKDFGEIILGLVDPP